MGHQRVQPFRQVRPVPQTSVKTRSDVVQMDVPFDEPLPQVQHPLLVRRREQVD